MIDNPIGIGKISFPINNMYDTPENVKKIKRAAKMQPLGGKNYFPNLFTNSSSEIISIPSSFAFLFLADMDSVSLFTK